MEWEAIVCLTSNWLLLKVLQHVMPGVASGDGWGILLIPLGQGILEPSILRGPYGCRTEGNTNFSAASHVLVLGSC